MKESDKHKLKEGTESLSAFFKQFGPLDIYSRIVLEVLFEELLGENNEDLSLLSKKGQDTSKAPLPSQGQQGRSSESE